MSKKNSRKPPQAPSTEAVTQEQVPWWLRILREPLALGMTVLILLRPWIDGITYPVDNFYFIWGIMLLFAAWAAKTLLRGEAIRFGIPILLLTAFWGIGAATLASTVQFDATYRTMILWTGHLMLFVLATNAVRSRTAIGIILVAYVISCLAETAWSLVHLKYVIPMVREAVTNNPGLLKTYFGTTNLNLELIHRLQVNRAFGSLLFPNALAAFLIAAIPCALTWAIASARGLSRDVALWREARRGKRSSGQTAKKKATDTPSFVADRAFRPAARGVAFWISLAMLLVVLCTSFFLFSFIGTFEFPVPKTIERLGPLVHSAESGYGMAQGAYVAWWVLFVVLLPLSVGAGAFYVSRRYGLLILGDVLRVAILFPLLVLELVALWVTYSRGGALSLMAAAVFTLGLLLFGRYSRLHKHKVSAAGRVAAAVALITALTVVMLMPALEAGAAPGESGATVDKPRAAQPSPPVQVQTTQGLADKSPRPQQNLKEQSDKPKGQPQKPAGRPQRGNARARPNPITKEGVDLTFKDLANPASLRLRITYWRTAIDMALDNLFTGVGLGNFGVIYPKYQRLGAGDVKAAHNDYLQALCETGLFGCLVFCAFWAYFFFWGARRLVRETDSQERLMLTGLYCGVLAFTIHSALDFNFFNPALAFFALLLAGIFLSRSSLDEAPAPSSPRYQLLAIPMLVATALIAGMALRVYMCAYIAGDRKLVNVANHRMMNAAYDTGEFFMKAADLRRQRKAPTKDMVSVAKLVTDRSALESIGSIRVRAPGSPSGHRPLSPGEPVTDNAFLLVTKVYKARDVACKHAEMYLEELGYADQIYPHDPELAAYFVQWYDLLSSTIEVPKVKYRYIVEFVRWAEIAVARSPAQSIYHEWLAKALFVRAGIDSGAGKRQLYDRAMAEYKKAAGLYPISVPVWQKYSKAAIKYGKALKAAGDTTAGDARIKEGKDALARAQALIESTQAKT